MSYPNPRIVGKRLIEALGLDPTRVPEYHLNVSVRHVITAEVTILLTDEQAQKTEEVLRDYYLLEKQPG